MRRTRVEVDLAAIRRNAAALHEIAGERLYGVVKADAYGHGAVPVARALAGQPGVAGLAVSLIEEGIELRDAGVAATILVMGPRLGDSAGAVVDHGLVPMVSCYDDLERFAELGRKRGEPVTVHVKVDTGMHRLGLSFDQAVGQIVAAQSRGGLVLEGLATHLACADEDSADEAQSPTRQQYDRFARLRDDLLAAGVTFAQHHAANSAATVVFGRAFPLGHTRPGLALYGNGLGDGLVQAMRLVTEVGALREIPAGDAVSYGFAWRAKRPSLVAVLPIGYADGYPRRVSNRAEVLVRGQRCPVVGKVCMDMTLVDVTDIADRTRVGDPVVALGDQANDRISTAELAEWASLTEYEVTCGVSKRVPRVYRGAEESP